MTISPGDNVGPYRVIEPLGQGGMATVFKAYHPALDRYVAIKVLHPAFKEDSNFLARFNREARIVAKLDHPNIIPIYDFSEHAGTPYLVMRYIEGKTLKAILREGKLPMARVLAIIRPVTQALAYAHAQGVLHRDIKPSNVMCANDGHIYLTDFGLARIAAASDSTLSQDMLIGTPQYISPEQARGVSASECSDIYSLGVVLFEMLTGRVPFSADTPYAVIHDHIYTPLPLPTSINPQLSPDIERVLLKALAKDSSARFAHATDLMTALEQAAQTAPAVAAPPAPTPTLAAAAPPPAAVSPTATPTPTSAPVAAASVAPPRRSRRTAFALGVVALLVLIACGALVMTQREVIARVLKGVAPVSTRLVRPTTAPDAVAPAKTRVAVNPRDPNAHVQLGDAFVKAKEYEAAFGEYDQAIKLDPKSPHAYAQAGQLATRLGDLDRASKYYTAGRNAAPEDMDLLLGQGDLFFKGKKYDDARAAYEKALRLKPDSAPALWRLGDLDRAQGKAAEALRNYTRALTLDPNLPEAHFGLGMLAVGRGANDEAKRQFTLVINDPAAPPDLKDQAAKQLSLIGDK
jgi:serine/threonine-protein kinase